MVQKAVLYCMYCMSMTHYYIVIIEIEFRQSKHACQPRTDKYWTLRGAAGKEMHFCFCPAGDSESSVGEERVRVRKECLTFTCHAAPQLPEHVHTRTPHTHTDTHTLTGGAQGDKRQKRADGERRRMLEGSRKETMEQRGVEPRARTRGAGRREAGLRIKDGSVFCWLVEGLKGVGVWSQPKGPPPQGRHTIKHSELKCVMAGSGSGFRNPSGRLKCTGGRSKLCSHVTNVNAYERRGSGGGGRVDSCIAGP